MGGRLAGGVKGAGWRNRIVGHGEEAPDQLLANALNWRIHPKAQQEALAGVLDEVGWVQDIIVNQRTGNVVDGHLRASLAIGRGEQSVPVVYVDLDEPEEKLILATIDPLAAMAVTDTEQLAALLAEVTVTDQALTEMLAGLAVKAGVAPMDDPNAEWTGMPAFEHEDKTAHRTIHVHFKDADAVTAFAELVGQQITESTKYIWHPKQEIIRYGEAHES